MHRSPDHWDDPNAFRPLRFHPEQGSQRPAGLYVPFAMGPHRCAATHVALPIIEQMVVTIMDRFRVEPAPGFVPRPVGSIALRSGSGMRLVLVSRA